MKNLSTTSKKKSKRNYGTMNLAVLASLFILQLVACPLWGQAMLKKQLTESDYATFGELFYDKISPDGRWIAIRMAYDSGLDTLFIKNTAGSKRYIFPKGSYVVFAGSKHAICKDPKQRYIQNLESGIRNAYPANSKIEYAHAANTIAILLRNDQVLELQDLKSNTMKRIHHVSDFVLSPSSGKILITLVEDQKHSIGIADLKADAAVSWILENSLKPFSSAVWQEDSQAVAFYCFSDADSDETNLYSYTLKTRKLNILNSKSINFPVDKTWDRNYTYRLDISDSARKVFFGFLPKNLKATKNKDSVEIWKTDDKWIFPLEQASGRFKEKANLAIWNPSDGSVLQITSPEFPKVTLTGNKSYAIVSNPQQYEPQFEENGPRDFYLMDLRNGQKELLCKNQSEFYTDLLSSPTGRYIAYFKDSDWWIYDIMLKTHANITKNIAVAFSFKSRNHNRTTAYGIGGWSSNDQYILLYDQYDIWKIKADGTSIKKLTDGRNWQIKFRINSKGSYDLLARNYDGYSSKTIDIEKRLVLRAEGNDGRTGFYLWDGISKARPVVYEDKYIDKIDYIEQNDLFVFREQSYDLSPRIIVSNRNKERKTAYISNPQQQIYQWGKAELVEFTNSKGNNFKGVLYYPADFKADQKYPMIVHIYEKQSPAYNHYIVPSLFMSGGYNPTVLSARGYFVLCPDIDQETGKVGEIALDFTVSAVQQILRRGNVKADKVGLIGHSFGAYETNFIITQTDLFAAAVSGAGLSDLNSHYLNVGWDLNVSDMVRFENGQYRMGQGLFENPMLYRSNSPVTHAADIKTPLLIWAGKSDWHVNWNQSIELYMALRRLGKTGKMLLYPNEKHAIIQKANQKNLSGHINHWFDHYLKDESPKSSIGGPYK